jgi:hypothetical protein
MKTIVQLHTLGSIYFAPSDGSQGDQVCTAYKSGCQGWHTMLRTDGL